MRPAQPLSPQHTGGSIPSTVSYSTNTTWVSSMTSYPPSAGVDEYRGHMGGRHGKDRISPRGSRAERPAVSKKSSSGNSMPLSELSKQQSNSSLISPQMSAYSNFDLMSPPRLVSKDKSSSFSQSKVKIKPLLRKISSHEHNAVDLSRSVAENEGLGIFTNSSSTGAVGRRGYHTRTSSGVSQVSTTTTSSVHRPGAQYIHPMRQTPQSHTPTLAHSRSREDDHFPYSQSLAAKSYAPLPKSKHTTTTPPPLQVRTYSNSSRANSATQLHINTNVPGTPSSLRHPTPHNSQPEPFSPESMPLTARSSLESAFGRKRSRANTISDDPYVAVQALRAEFAAREAAKDAKYAEKEARRQEKRERSERRKEEAAERKRTRSVGQLSEKDGGKEGDGLSAIEYSNTIPGLPVDEELEWIRRGKRPPQRAQARRTNTGESGGSAMKKKAKAFGNGWGMFWFQVKTWWLKVKRGMGMKSG